jgi:hypothetical protein
MENSIELQKRFGLPTTKQHAYAEYLTKGEALKQAADEEKHANLVSIGEVQSALMAETGTAKRGRRGGVTGPRKAYNITPQSKVAAATKRAETRARKGGASEGEAKKAGKEAGKSLAAKLGI